MLAGIVRTTVHFLKAEDGPTAVEYAVMLCLIIVVCFAVISTIGSHSNSNFSNVALQAATQSTSS